MSDAKHTPFPVDPKSIDSLIAAAPDLLAALEKLLSRATPFANHWKDDPELVEAYAAIAKAKGGAA